jgi:hypothetical protein
VRNLLPALARGQLDAETHGRVTGHLDRCEACDEALWGEIKAGMQVGDIPVPAIPPWPGVPAPLTPPDPRPTWWEKLRRTLEWWRPPAALRPVPTWGGSGEERTTLPAEWLDAQGQSLGRPPVEVEVIRPPVVSANGEFALALRLLPEAVGGTVVATLLLVERGEVSVEAEVEGEEVTLAATGWPALEEEVPVPLENIRLCLRVGQAKA